jgi:hypothetical protein
VNAAHIVRHAVISLCFAFCLMAFFWLGMFSVIHGPPPFINPSLSSPYAVLGLVVFCLLITVSLWYIWIPAAIVIAVIPLAFMVPKRLLWYALMCALLCGIIAHACCVPDSAFHL